MINSATTAATSELDRLLAFPQSEVGNGNVLAAVNALIDGLRSIRSASTDDRWNNEVRPRCLKAPIRDILHQDPYTLRAFEKPRGYAGDAVMLDYVYGQVPPEGTSTDGIAVFKATTGGANGQSVRDRLRRLAALIDQVAEERASPTIVALACGHLREAELSSAVRKGRIQRFVALDQDAESIAVVQQEKAAMGVEALRADIRSVINGSQSFSDVDLVYAAGLFDYLRDGAAARLAVRMIEMLSQGGRLVIANFLPDSHGRGYMEAFMDWHLIYRSENDLASLLSPIPHCARRLRTYRDSLGNVAYLEVERA